MANGIISNQTTQPEEFLADGNPWLLFKSNQRQEMPIDGHCGFRTLLAHGLNHGHQHFRKGEAGHETATATTQVEQAIERA